MKDKNVLDIGSGCGASAIACSLSGAKYVFASDIDLSKFGSLNFYCSSV